MRIDLQIPAHLGNEVAADLFLSILEGGEFFTEIQTAVASLSLVGHEFAGDLFPPCEPPQPALEFRPLHNTRIGHFCPSVKSRNTLRRPEAKSSPLDALAVGDYRPVASRRRPPSMTRVAGSQREGRDLDIEAAPVGARHLIGAVHHARG